MHAKIRLEVSKQTKKTRAQKPLIDSRIINRYSGGQICEGGIEKVDRVDAIIYYFTWFLYYFIMVSVCSPC